MQRSVTSSLRGLFRKGQVGYRFSIFLAVIVSLHLMLMAISPLVRLYTLAYLGSSEAMYHLADEYYMHPSSVVFRPNAYRGDYWIRKSASKGNLHAIQFIEIAWGRVNSDEVVTWLQKGIEFEHPWCAEQLAKGYQFGLYGLTIDKNKVVEYRKIGVQFRAEGKGDRDE